MTAQWEGEDYKRSEERKMKGSQIAQHAQLCFDNASELAASAVEAMDGIAQVEMAALQPTAESIPQRAHAVLSLRKAAKEFQVGTMLSEVSLKSSWRAAHHDIIQKGTHLDPCLRRHVKSVKDIGINSAAVNTEVNNQSKQAPASDSEVQNSIHLPSAPSPLRHAAALRERQFVSGLNQGTV